MNFAICSSYAIARAIASKATAGCDSYWIDHDPLWPKDTDRGEQQWARTGQTRSIDEAAGAGEMML